MKKKTIMIACVTAVVLAASAGGAGWYFLTQNSQSTDNNLVYVNSVESIMNISSGNGMQNRFAGVVEPQETWKVEQNPEKPVKEILVEEGQEVTVGEVLFHYDTEKYQEDLSQAELDLERIANELENMNSQIALLEKEKKKAGKEEKLDYTLQIQEAKLNLKSKEYEQKGKEKEIAKLHENIENASVHSEIAGVVKKINRDASGGMYGEPQPLLTILALGDYRIKGQINEQNMGSLMEGMPVIIRSRLDKNQTWNGTMGMIDTESAIQNNNNMMYGNADSMSQTNSYPFYVNLENSEGLMLGQHVSIESDQGQNEPKKGVWLDSYFLGTEEDGSSYVWADNGKGRLEKRKVTTGQTDEGTGRIEIAEGLEKEDKITFPEEGLKDGMKTAEGENGRMGQSNPPMPENVGEPELPADGELPEMGGELAIPEGEIGEGLEPTEEGQPAVEEPVETVVTE